MAYDAGSVAQSNVLAQLASTAAGQGDALLAVLAPFTGAAVRTQHAVNEERISAFGFGALGDASGKTLSAVTSWGGVNTTGWTLLQWQSIFPFATSLTNTLDWCALQALLNAAQASSNPATYGSNSPAAGPCEAFIPSGDYQINMPLTITKKVAIRGEGPAETSSGTRIIQLAANTDLFQVNPIAQGMSLSLTNLTLGAGNSGTGALYHQTINANNTGMCNSMRIDHCFFETPEALAINIEGGDEIMITDCTFDISATACIMLGTSADQYHCASNVSILNCHFFDVLHNCIAPYNVNGLQVIGCECEYDNNALYGKTNVFVDAYNTLPYLLQNISLIGNHFGFGNTTLMGTQAIFWGTNVKGLTISDNSGINLGGGTNALVYLTGTTTNLVMSGNRFSGATGANNFIYNTGTITNGNISGNSFVNTGTTSASCLGGMNQSGLSVSDNNIAGFTVHSISERIVTSGNSVQPSPSTITSLNIGTQSFTVQGASQGDLVSVGPAGVSWFAPTGFVVSAYVSAPNTVTVAWANVTGGTIGVPASDISLMVRR